MKVRIKDAKPMRVGNSHYFLIPAQFMTNEVINSNDKYDIEIDKAQG